MRSTTSDRETTTVPSEPVGPPPRTVTLNLDGDARYLVVIAILFFGVGGIWLGLKGYDDIQQFRQRAVLRSDSREAAGEVTGFSFGRNTPITVHYRFAVQGNTYSGRAEEPRTGTSLNKSDKILIRFLPSNPAVNHPDAWEWSPTIGLEFVAGQVFFWILGCVAVVALLRDRKLARHGKSAPGKVLTCAPNGQIFTVEYEFLTEDGASLMGKSDCEEESKPGAKIWILYLPARPRRNQAYPLAFFDVAE